MTSQLTFFRGGEIALIRIEGDNLLFSDTGIAYSPIENLKLDITGCLKEHPDLQNNPDWRLEVIKRFKEHFKNIKSNSERIEYIKNELKKFGWTPKYFQRKGFRMEVLNE